MFNKTFYKTPGFYVAIAAIILSVIGSIFYFSFSGDLSEYKNVTSTIFAFVGILVYMGLVCFRKTDKFSGLGLWAFLLVTFVLYIHNVYMYFSGIFYNGITSEALKLIDSKVILSAVFYLLSVVVANVSIYLKHERTEIQK